MKARTATAALCVLVAAAVPAGAARHAKRAKPVDPALSAARFDPVPALLPPPPTGQPSLTLDDALAIAYETNPQFAAQQAGLRATDEGVAIANSNWHPQIGAQGTYAYNQYYFFPIPAGSFPGQISPISSLSAHPLQGGLTITQPIFRGGRTVAEIGRAKALVRAGRAQLLAAEQTVLLDAATAYMDVVRDTVIVTLRQHNVQVLQKQLSSTQAEFTAGSLTRTDVAQSQARLAVAQSDLMAATSQLQVSRANFVQSVGREAETLEQEPALPHGIPTTIDDSITLAVRQNPSIVSARENEVAADYAVDDSVGALLPSVSVQAQYGYGQGSLISPTGSANVDVGEGPPHTANHFVAVTGQLNVPIYEGGSEEAAVRQAKQLHAQAQFTVSQTDRQVRDAVATAWAAFEAAEANIASNEASEKANEIAYEGVYKEQQVGGRTILDVLNAEQELLNAAVSVVTAKRNAEVAAFEVLAANGSLTAKTLGLKVKLYDPLEYYDDNAARWIGLGD